MNNSWYLKDLKNVPQNGLKVMSTFSCGGGSSMGYKLAGCDVIAANDIDSEMAYHYKLNLKPKHYFLCPVKDLLKKELPDELYHLDILDGSPPCSTFSMAGNRDKDWGKKKYFREGQAAQILDNLFFDYLDLIEYLKPKVAIAENVKGMLKGNAQGYCKMIINRFKDIGYNPQLFLINAADCGVPQRRERVFFIALRDDINKPKLILAPKHRWISAGEAISDLQVLTDDEIRETKPAPTDLKWWPLTNKGEGYDRAVARARLKPKLWNYKKLNDKAPANTLPADNSVIMHWNECRRLTYREYKRLNSFPDDYQAKTDKIGKYMVGMSVPPRMTEQIAKAVIERWL